MIQLFKDVNIDWLGKRQIFIAVSVLLMLIGMGSALYRHRVHPHGTDAFNLGVDFKGGTVMMIKFRQRPTAETIHAALAAQGVADPVVQPVTDKTDEVLVRLPLEGPAVGATGESGAQVDVGQVRVRKALGTFGPEAAPDKDLTSDANAAYKIVGTEAVGPVAGQQLRNKAIAVTLAALVGILLFIAFRYEWTYGAAAVIAVFHTVLVTLGLFSIMQVEINLTVIAALLTLVGFDVNDTIVVFDRIRENRKLHRRMSLYEVTNLSINQTLSRTVITSGLVFLSVISLVLFGGSTLRPFSLALLFGISFGTYSSVAIASPIMVWWEQRLEAANRAVTLAARPVPGRANPVGPRPAATANAAGKQSRQASRG